MRHDQIPDDLRPLAFEFFYWFSRFEFALKYNRILKSDTVGRRAEPGWTKFIRTFETGYKISSAGQKLVDANPRRQLVGEHDLEFVDLIFDQGATDLERVVRLAQTVRNNLFHGGKSGHDGWDDPKRMRLLLELTQPVLDELAELGGFTSDYRGEY
jgi:hypothetical protein